MIRNNRFLDYLDEKSKKTSWEPMDSSELITNVYTNYLYNYDSKSVAQNPKKVMHEYIIWQEDHDVNDDMLFDKHNDRRKEKKILTPKLETITDILTLIDTELYDDKYEYNIDLKALCDIKPELVDLNNMVGLVEMKESIVEQLLYFIQRFHKKTKCGDYKHTVLYGVPGIGKTEVAKIIGKMYSKIGVLSKNTFKKVTRNDLVAGYLGQTALKTRKVIDEALGGVLFIDEAYSLSSGTDSNDSYSKECIDVICEALSDHKDDLMVIIAGYEQELENNFFNMNRGLPSRFIWRFSMKPYTPPELKQIFASCVTKNGWSLVDNSLKDEWFIKHKDDFASYGRDMEALLTFVKIAHSKTALCKPDEEKCKISFDDIENGYKVFMKNKKKVEERPVYLKHLYV